MTDTYIRWLLIITGVFMASASVGKIVLAESDFGRHACLLPMAPIPGSFLPRSVLLIALLYILYVLGIYTPRSARRRCVLGVLIKSASGLHRKTSGNLRNSVA